MAGTQTKKVVDPTSGNFCYQESSTKFDTIYTITEAYKSWSWQ